MNERDLNLDRMREAILKLDVTQYAKAEVHLAKEELREYIRQDLGTSQNEVRQERRKFYGKVFIVVAFLIGGDVWTMWGVYQHMQQVLQVEVDKNRKKAAEVLAAETENIRTEVRKRIESEFQTPQVRDVVRAVAREKADQELTAIIREEVSKQVQVAVNRQEGEIRAATEAETRQAVRNLEPTMQSIVTAQVGTKVTEALRPLDTALKKYREILHTGSLATTAMAGSRSAHLQLMSVLNSSDPDIREIASWAVAAVDEELLDMLRGGTLNPALSRDDLLALSNTPSPTMRLKVVEQMGLSKDRRYIPRIVEMIKSDPNIRVFRAALVALTRETGLTLESSETGATKALEWWEQHKSEFK